MVKCTFSGREIPPGKGIMFVREDGRILYFYNRKAEKNFFKLNRKPRETRWTSYYAKGG